MADKLKIAQKLINGDWHVYEEGKYSEGYTLKLKNGRLTNSHRRILGLAGFVVDDDGRVLSVGENSKVFFDAYFDGSVLKEAIQESTDTSDSDDSPSDTYDTEDNDVLVIGEGDDKVHVILGTDDTLAEEINDAVNSEEDFEQGTHRSYDFGIDYRSFDKDALDALSYDDLPAGLKKDDIRKLSNSRQTYTDDGRVILTSYHSGKILKILSFEDFVLFRQFSDKFDYEWSQKCKDLVDKDLSDADFKERHGLSKSDFREEHERMANENSEFFRGGIPRLEYKKDRSGLLIILSVLMSIYLGAYLYLNFYVPYADKKNQVGTESTTASTEELTAEYADAVESIKTAEDIFDVNMYPEDVRDVYKAVNAFSKDVSDYIVSSVFTYPDKTLGYIEVSSGGNNYTEYLADADKGTYILYDWLTPLGKLYNVNYDSEDYDNLWVEMPDLFADKVASRRMMYADYILSNASDVTYSGVSSMDLGGDSEVKVKKFSVTLPSECVRYLLGMDTEGLYLAMKDEALDLGNDSMVSLMDYYLSDIDKSLACSEGTVVIGVNDGDIVYLNLETGGIGAKANMTKIKITNSFTPRDIPDFSNSLVYYDSVRDLADYASSYESISDALDSMGKLEKKINGESTVTESLESENSESSKIVDSQKKAVESETDTIEDSSTSD